MFFLFQLVSKFKFFRILPVQLKRTPFPRETVFTQSSSAFFLKMDENSPDSNMATDVHRSRRPATRYRPCRRRHPRHQRHWSRNPIGNPLYSNAWLLPNATRPWTTPTHSVRLQRLSALPTNYFRTRGDDDLFGTRRMLFLWAATLELHIYIFDRKLAGIGTAIDGSRPMRFR